MADPEPLEVGFGGGACKLDTTTAAGSCLATAKELAFLGIESNHARPQGLEQRRPNEPDEIPLPIWCGRAQRSAQEAHPRVQPGGLSGPPAPYQLAMPAHQGPALGAALARLVGAIPG